MLRFSLLLAPVLVALAAPAADAAPPPRVHQPRAAHVIPTPRGDRLTLAIPVTARRVGARRTTVRLRVAVRLPGGKVVRSTVSTRDHGASARVEHHVHFSPQATRQLRRAQAPRPRLWAFQAVGADAAAQIQPLAATISAVQAVDNDADGQPEDVSPPTTLVTTLPATTPAAPQDAALTGHARGTDPCGTYYPLAENLCDNAAGTQWGAAFFWDHDAWSIHCPLDDFASGKTTVDTDSNSYTQTTTAIGATSYVYITDDNLHGHPIRYTPYVACLAPGYPSR
jgi:hypothetical protein